MTSPTQPPPAAFPLAHPVQAASVQAASVQADAVPGNAVQADPVPAKSADHAWLRAAAVRRATVRFVKMHGLGNDFVLLDARARPVELDSAMVRRLADRRLGVGCDQLIRLEPPTRSDADVRMRIWNADGGEVSACGNAARCVAVLVGLPAAIETAAGLLRADGEDAGPRVDMGEPRFEWDAVPLAYPLDTARLPLAWGPLQEPVALSVGNPHLVFFVDDAQAVPLDALGPEIEHDPLFPERINVNVAEIVAGIAGGSRVRLRTWERGVGLTPACGTGACATAAAARRRGLVGREVTVEQAGGELRIRLGEDGHIHMTGPVTLSFRGELELERFR